MRKTLLIGLLLLIVFLGIGFFLKRHSSEEVRPRIAPIVDVIYGLGTVNATHSYQLKLGVAETITRLFIDEGANVQKNDPIVTLRGIGIIRAPFAGTITSLPFEEGENIFPEAPIFTLVDLVHRYITVALEQRNAVKARPGQLARISLESLRNVMITGTVRSIYPNQNQFMVRIDTPNLPASVLPGMTADVAIEVGRKDHALLVPVKSIVGGKITLIRNGHKENLPVTTGATDDQGIEITSNNIRPDDEIVVPQK